MSPAARRMSRVGWWYVEIPIAYYSAQNINKITVSLLLVENRTLGYSLIRAQEGALPWFMETDTGYRVEC